MSSRRTGPGPGKVHRRPATALPRPPDDGRGRADFRPARCQNHGAGRRGIRADPRADRGTAPRRARHCVADACRHGCAGRCAALHAGAVGSRDHFARRQAAGGAFAPAGNGYRHATTATAAHCPTAPAATTGRASAAATTGRRTAAAAATSTATTGRRSRSAGTAARSRAAGKAAAGAARGPAEATCSPPDRPPSVPPCPLRPRQARRRRVRSRTCRPWRWR